MSKPTTMPATVGSAFFDFEKMRSDILKRQHEAMRPFQLELRELEIVESMLQRQVDPGIDAHEQLIAKAKARQPRAKPNGQHLPYAAMTQRKAIVEILGQEPGLEAYEVIERLIAGGYPFLSEKPAGSVHVSLRKLVEDGKLERKDAPGNRRKTKVHHYYPVADTAGEALSARVLGILERAPEGGYDRGEIVALLEKRQYPVERKRLTWTLNSFVQRGHVKRHLHGKPADTRFTLIEA